jgi:hypothetical protein
MTDDPIRQRAVALYNQSWDLLEDPKRDADRDRKLLLAACGSRACWEGVGDAENMSVGDWMVSRVLAELGAADLAVSFAQSAHDLVEGNDAPIWMRASAMEGLARAYAAAGDAAQRDRHVALASDLVNQIPDLEDRELIAAQLATVPEVAH